MRRLKKIRLVNHFHKNKPAGYIFSLTRWRFPGFTTPLLLLQTYWNESVAFKQCPGKEAYKKQSSPNMVVDALDHDQSALSLKWMDYFLQDFFSWPGLVKLRRRQGALLRDDDDLKIEWQAWIWALRCKPRSWYQDKFPSDHWRLKSLDQGKGVLTFWQVVASG